VRHGSRLANHGHAAIGSRSTRASNRSLAGRFRISPRRLRLVVGEVRDHPQPHRIPSHVGGCILDLPTHSRRNTMSFDCSFSMHVSLVICPTVELRQQTPITQAGATYLAAPTMRWHPNNGLRRCVINGTEDKAEDASQWARSSRSPGTSLHDSINTRLAIQAEIRAGFSDSSSLQQRPSLRARDIDDPRWWHSTGARQHCPRGVNGHEGPSIPGKQRIRTVKPRRVCVESPTCRAAFRLHNPRKRGFGSWSRHEMIN